ncbi:MAG: NUDIX domain-containing protein [Anaerolineaceae bacterium]
MTKRIRNSAKAIIIRDNHLLVIRKTSSEGGYAVVPGGGQKKSETLAQALKRECLEEINSKVKVGELIFLREYFSDNHEFANEAAHVHQVEFYFACSIKDDNVPCQGLIPDPGQIEIVWVPIDQLDSINLYPKAIIPIIQSGLPAGHPIYLGDVN